MKKLSAFERHRLFKEGQDDVQDDPRSGQPKRQTTDAHVDKVQTMMNQQCYMEVMTRLWESVWRKRHELWPDKLILHHDNAPGMMH
jgi:hypothetical protein